MRRSLLLFTSKTIKTICFGLLASAFLSALPARAAGTVWTVTSTADSATDTTTLRGAVNAAADSDIINLQGLTGTIVLTLGEIGIGKNLSILGPGPSLLAVSGNHMSRVFHVQFGSTASGPDVVTIESITIENGNGNISTGAPDDNGGAIRTTENLILVGCNLINNSATMSGGAVYVFPGAVASVADTTFSNNSAPYGGAFYSDL